MNPAFSFEGSHPPVTYTNVAIATGPLTLVIVMSIIFRLGVGMSMFIASLRCITQLSIGATILALVFTSKNPFVVFATILVVLLLSSAEVVYSPLRHRPQGLFQYAFLSLLLSVIPIAILGARFSIIRGPFWSPTSLIPIVGMLTGNAIGGMAVSSKVIVRELLENKDKVEAYLAHGANRYEACMPIGREAVKLGLLPTITMTAVIGVISIPGMMTGAILGGEPVEQAAKMQIIIMFLIMTATSIAVVVYTYSLLSILVDSDHFIRIDRIYTSKMGLLETLRCLVKRLYNVARPKSIRLS